MLLKSLTWIVFLMASNLSCYAMDGLNSLFGAMDDLVGGVVCEYECPNGEEPIKNLKHVPVSNGCGSYGFKLEIEHFPDLQPCCDTHDICYDTCGKLKSSCDNDFNTCLTKACRRMKKKGILSDKEYKGCTTTVNLLHGGLLALGCNAYLEAQKNACICPSKHRKDRFEL